MPSTYIGNVKLDNNLVLAPMSGVTCMSFRRLLKELNQNSIGLVVTEFISVEGMTRKSKKTLDMMRFTEMERPISIQIFGYDVYRMSEASKMCQDAGADIVDINCGCPAPKVVKKGGGCELMRQPNHLAKIFASVRKAISIPLTMKMRSGWDDNSKNCLDIARIAQAEGVEAITIHGRTRVQLYRGVADWSFAQKAKAELKIPVFGSGDVTNQTDAVGKFKTGVDGLYIGRASLANPLVFKEVLEDKTDTLLKNPNLYIKIIDRYIQLLSEEFNENGIVGKLKQLVSQMVKGQNWRKEILLARSLQEIKSILAKNEQYV